MSSSNMQIYEACHSGHRGIAKSLLLESQISRGFTRLPSVDTSLHQACRQGWLDIVELLIKKCGFSPDITGKNGESPLHYACKYGRFDIVKYLIKQGSSPRMKDKLGREPLDYAFQYNQTNIACYLCQNYISSAELLAPDRNNRNLTIVRKILQHDLWQQLLQLKTIDGDSFLNLVFYSSSMITSCMSSKRFTQKLKSVTNAENIDTIPHLIVRLCHCKSSVACVPSAVMSDWLNDTRLDIKELVVSCNWKTADGDTLLQIICQSKSCVSRISSVTMKDWLIHTNTDIIIIDVNCVTSDSITLLTIVDQIDSITFENKDFFSHNSTIDAIVTPHWGTDDGHSSIKVLFRSELYISCRSSIYLMEWLSKTSLDLNRIVTVNMKTIDDQRVLERLFKSESCISCMSSELLLKWLTNKIFDLEVLIIPNWKTADGNSLLQIICKSKSCVSRISSIKMIDWLVHTDIDLFIDDLNCVTSDGITLSTIVDQIDSKSFEYKEFFSHNLTIDAIVTPNWGTDDGRLSIKVLFRSELYISCRSSTYLMEWLSKTSLDLNRIVTVNMKTIDDQRVLEHLFKSESCISCMSSELLLKWLTNKIFDLEVLIIPNWKTADGNSLLQIMCKSKSCVSRISSIKMIDWLVHTNIDLFIDDLNCVTSDGITLLTIVDQIDSKSFEHKDFFSHNSTIDAIITPNWETDDGHSSLKVLFQSELYISCGSSTCLTKWLSKTSLDLDKIVTLDMKTTDDERLLELLLKSESCVSCVSSEVIVKWLSDTTVSIEALIMPNFKTADGETLLQLICESESFVSQISSNTIMKWLTESTIDITKPVIHNWKTADGDTLLDLLCNSEECISLIPSTVMVKLLADTTLDFKSLNNIIVPKWVTADGDTLLELIIKTESCLSRIPSKVIINWLMNTSLNVIVPNYTTADGETLLQLVCNLESCVSRVSSIVIMEWLKNTTLDLTTLIRPNWKTADGYSLLQLVFMSESCMSRIPSSVIMEWLRNTSQELTLLILPDSKTADDHTLLELVCSSEFCLSQITSRVILNWLHESKGRLNGSILSSFETADGDSMLKILCSSESAFSHSSSSLMLRWINEGDESTFNTLKTTSPNWVTFDGDAIFHLLCQTDSKEQEINKLLEYYLQNGSLNPNITNSEGNTAAHLACKFGKLSLVTFLITKVKCDVNVKNNAELYPLDMTMDPEIIFFFLREYDSLSLSSTTVERWLNNSAMIDEQNLLHIFKLLARKGAIASSTLLHLTCSRVHDIFRYSVSLANVLLGEVHCDPNCQDNNNLMPLQVTSDLKIMKTLVQYGAKVTPDVVFKVIAISAEQTVVAKMLQLSLRKKTLAWNPNDMNEDGDTALHLACKVDKPIIVSFLVSECRCHPNFKNLQNQVPLELTINMDCITTLIEHGASLTPELLLKFVSEESIPKHLLPEVIHNPDYIINSEGNTALHLACKMDKQNIVNFLLSLIHCDPNIKNNNDEVPLQMTTNPDIIKNLIKHGAQTSKMYESHKSALGTNQPIRSPVKVFVVGNRSVGKSTLTAALKTELNFVISLFTSEKVSDVEEKTAGIVPHEFDSAHFGRVTLYDFAGHREFYSGHAALLQAAVQSTPPIFLLVVNLCDEDSKILQDILYWISFLENQCALVSCKPHIIIVGSHADTLKSRGINPKIKINTLSNLLLADYFFNLEFIDFIAMNCQLHKSASINDLRRILVKSCEQLHIQEPITFNAHCFLVYLIDAFKQISAVTFGTIHDHIEQQRLSKEAGVLEFLPLSFKALYRICVELNDRGHILFLKDKTDIQNSYIVIDKAFLLSEVSGTVFASEHFKVHKDLATSTGVVSKSKLTQCFPNIDIKVLLGFLCHLEFCQEISDQTLRKRISECYSQGCDDAEHYYLFPDLISIEATTAVWEDKSPFKFHFGWIVRCTKPDQFFSPRFLQVLLLRLAFSFALESANEDQSFAFLRRCTLWKNGIFWGTHFGMQVLVEILNNKSVIVMSRFNESDVVKCIKQRSQVIKTVLDCTEQFSPRISLIESLIDSSLALRHPFFLNSNQIQCTVKELAEALISNCESPSVVLSENGNCVPVKSFISFEPYSEIEAASLAELWNESNANIVITDVFLSRFVEKMSQNLGWIVKIFHESAHMPHSPDSLQQEIMKWRDKAKLERMTYKQLRQKLDEHSIFAGRNILVSVIITLNDVMHRLFGHHYVHFNFVQNLADNRILPNSEGSGLSVIAADGSLTPTLIQGTPLIILLFYRLFYRS